MIRLLHSAATLALVGILAFQATAAFADPKTRNTVAIESLTIAHEGFEPATQQRDTDQTAKQQAAPKAPSSGDPEWKYLPVRRY